MNNEIKLNRAHAQIDTRLIEAGIRRQGALAWMVRDLLQAEPRDGIADALAVIVGRGSRGRSAALHFAASCAERAQSWARDSDTRAIIHARRARSAAQAAAWAEDLATIEGLTCYAAHCAALAADASGDTEAMDWQRQRLMRLAESLSRTDQPTEIEGEGK
jgi:hypothetical protein